MSRQPDDMASTRWSLIGRLKNWDDQESWRKFFDTYWRLIYSVAVRSGLSDAEAQDAVQETIISVCKGIIAFKADPALGSFKSWLLTLARCRITDQMRKRGRLVPHAERQRDLCSADTAGTAPEGRVPDPAGDSLDRIWDGEWRQHLIASALEKVKQQADAKHYQIFYLQTVKHVAPSTIAQTLSVPVDQVYLIKHRLSKLFQEALRTADTRVE